ncbi:MAG: S41 family peptidase [Sphaerochaetaceae bacterium]|jgi:carboxyl-terminal processing protease
MRKYKDVLFVIAFVFLLAPIAAALGTPESSMPSFFTASPSFNVNQEQDEITSNMQKLEVLYRLVQRDFLFDIDHKALYESMAKGLFSALDDKYSAYIVSQEADDFSEGTTGSYAGIGAYISKHYLEYRDFSKPNTYMVNITSVFPGSPAESAGLRSGDMISHIDGEAVDEWEANEASKALKGDPNTPVVLTVVRGGSSFDVTVIRKIVNVPTVSTDRLPHDIAYLRISQFTSSTAKQVREAFDTFLQEGLSGLVLDLRENPGGIVDGTLSIADMLLSNAPIVHVSSKNPSQNQTIRSTRGVTIPSNIPIVVLINKGSASSSEILAGALKDNNRATLIGSTSFGKGLIQVVSPFGDGYYTLTTSQYRTPSGSDIHEVGIGVDIEVKEAHVEEEDMQEYLDFLNSGVITTFVEEYPDYSLEHMDLFIKEYVDPDSHIGQEVFRLLLRREYLLQIPFEERPVADVEYDESIKRAILFLTTGE